MCVVFMKWWVLNLLVVFFFNYRRMILNVKMRIKRGRVGWLDVVKLLF